MQGRQTPRIHVRPPSEATFGDLAAELAGQYGLTPDPWQRAVLDDWLATAGGRWAALTCGLAVPRQNGKNAIVEVRELFGTVGRGERILHTAHEVKTAQKHFRRLKHFFGSRANDPAARFPELNALVAEVRNVNGQEGIFLTNGGSIELVARSKNSGRGYTVDVLVFDEAQELPEEAVEALMPTTSSAPLGDPQWIFTGTPPGPLALGEVFTRVRREALGEDPGRVAWHEWSVEGPLRDVDLDDTALWFDTNPSLGWRLQFEVVDGERNRFSDDGFARERLGLWAPDSAANAPKSAIDWDRWAALGTTQPPAAGRPAYAVKFSADGTRVALAVALAAADGVFHVELVEHRSTAAGVKWLVDWLVPRARTSLGVVVDGKSDSGALLQLLHAQRVPPRYVHTPTVDEVIAAHAMTGEAIRTGGLSHFHQPPLDLAVRGAGKRMIGKAGGWGWSALSPEIDVTPLEAVTLALHRAATSQRPKTTGEGRRGVLL